MLFNFVVFLLNLWIDIVYVFVLIEGKMFNIIFFFVSLDSVILFKFVFINVKFGVDVFILGSWFFVVIVLFWKVIDVICFFCVLLIWNSGCKIIFL